MLLLMLLKLMLSNFFVFLVNVGVLFCADVKLYAKFCFIEYDSETAAEVAVAAESGTVFKNVALGKSDRCNPVQNLCYITVIICKVYDYW